MPTPSAARLVLEEFRLFDGASHAAADLALAAADPGGVPLLTSIADDRDVVSVRCISAHSATEEDRIDHSPFDGLVSGWAPVRMYRPRIAESSLVPPASYQLAVTESGINGNHRTLAGRDPHADLDEAAPEDVRPVDLLWVGVPEGSDAGLLMVVGDGGSGHGPDAAWPLSLSQALGVRVYRGIARS